jgi:hypothetical protein
VIVAFFVSASIEAQPNQRTAALASAWGEQTTSDVVSVGTAADETRSVAKLPWNFLSSVSDFYHA